MPCLLPSPSSSAPPPPSSFNLPKPSWNDAFLSSDSIASTQSLSDGETLASREGSFELGFFSPGSSKNRYLGIWYKNIPVTTVVWVANRVKPINDSSGILMINNTGRLLLLRENRTVVWSTSSSTKQPQQPFLQLLDSGNLVVTDGKNANSEEDYLWQSFDCPSDTSLPGSKHGWDLRRRLNRRLTAWKNWDDPSPGDFSFGVELHNFPEAVRWKVSEKYSRTGPWNGIRVSGSPELRPNPVFEFKFVINDDEVYYAFYLKNKSVISRIVPNQSSYHLQCWMWIEAEKNWKLYSSLPKDPVTIITFVVPIEVVS